MRYADMRDRIETFDIVLLSGSGLISQAIKALTGSPWSHVAVALRLPAWDQVLC